MSRAGDAIRETGISLRTVFSNPNLRRLNLAFGGSVIGDWAYATAITIWAYEVGGVRAVGLFYTVRLLLLAVVTPFASTLADRLPRQRVMIASDLIRAVLCLAVAVLIVIEAPPISVFALATLAFMVGAPFRPAVGALLPAIARNPAELTAANATISTLESLAFFIGPAIGALLVGLIDIPIVVVFQALTFLWSAAMVSRIRVAAQASEPLEAALPAAERALADVPGAPALDRVSESGTPGAGEGDGGASGGADDGPGFLAESVEGFRTIWQSPNLRLIAGLYVAQTLVAGASAVFGVEMAVQMTDFGADGIGYLDSMMGVGAIVGGLVALSRASTGKLATDFGVGVLGWAVPLLATAIWPQAWAAFLAMLVIGLANPVVDINASTILQRAADDRVLARVFGALETALLGSLALGAALMPLLIHGVGLQGALAVLAIGMTVAVLPAFPRLRRMNGALREPEGLALLRSVPLFAPLDPKSLEAIAGRLVRVPVLAGATVIREGDAGDRFYLIESGGLTATYQDAVLSHMGPGDPFGEIALLRDVPRTASVTADVESVLLALERQDFLDAVTGDSEVNTRADDLVSRRIPTF